VVREQVLIEGYESSELGRTHRDCRGSHLAFSWLTSGGPMQDGAGGSVRLRRAPSSLDRCPPVGDDADALRQLAPNLFLFVLLASLRCGGRYDVCTIAQQHVAKCTARTLSTCDTDPLQHCIANCIVTIMPPCSAFRIMNLDPNSPPIGGLELEFANCIDACVRAYPSHD
jgi:hypothetical protein